MSSWCMVRAEWVKVRTALATTVLPVAVTVVTIALAAVVALTGSLQPDDTVVGASVTAGGTLGLLLAGVFGALVMAGEFGTGMIATTFAASPRRGRVLGSKAVVTAGVLGAAGLVGTVGAVAVGRVLLARSAHAAGSLVPEALGLAAVVSLAGLLGLAVGSVVRHPGGAVAVVLGLLLAPSLVGPLLGGLQPWVAGIAPTGVLMKLAQSSDAVPAAVGTLGGWPSLGVLAAYVVIALALAALVLDRRDA